MLSARIVSGPDLRFRTRSMLETPAIGPSDSVNSTEDLPSSQAMNPLQHIGNGLFSAGTEGRDQSKLHASAPPKKTSPAAKRNG